MKAEAVNPVNGGLRYAPTKPKLCGGNVYQRNVEANSRSRVNEIMRVT